MLKQKKQAVKRLMQVLDSQKKRLGESFYQHMGVSRYRTILWVSRFNLSTIEHAISCINQNKFDQSHLIMGLENNCSWIKAVRKGIYGDCKGILDHEKTMFRI